jgi:ATP-dependent Clp protease protease subunit
MTLRSLPTIKALDRPDGYHWDASSTALEKWAAVAPSAAAESDATITIYELIGEDFWSGGGFTAKRMSAALRSIGEKPVTVAINSPGGDMFEGLAIFNMLKDHKFEITVKVMGLAASAASLIAMAGDSIQMGQGSFLMIHNAWGAVVGDQHAMRDAADMFAPFDGAMAEIYAARAGLDVAEVSKMMDAETFINAKEALAKGFADTTFEATKAPETGDASARAELSAKRRLDALLARQGVARAERRKLFREAGMRNAAEPATPRAGFDFAAAERLLSALTP